MNRQQDSTIKSTIIGNHHCSVVDLDGRGVMIEGAPASGKTSLMLGLIERFKLDGRPAQMVCDDQAILYREGKNLFARAPNAIKGLVEIRGFGIVEMAYRSPMRIDLVGRLVEDDHVPRMADRHTTQIGGIKLDLIKLPRHHEAQSIRIISAWLKRYDLAENIKTREAQK